jgi:leucyl/phenylalanyl-tRNA---protein transferase
MNLQLQLANEITAVMASSEAAWSRNSFIGRIRHLVLGVAFALQLKRVHEALYIALLALRDRWGRRPITDATWRRKPIDAAGGLVFLSTDLSVENLVTAYARGIFPYCHIMPMKWWSPPKRMLLTPASIKIEKDVRRLLKRKCLEISFDRNFRGVVEACSAPRSNKHHLTWISPTVVEAFTRLHEAGYAHSVEVHEDGRLVGGLYGVAIRNVFFTESQFSRRRNASKVALAALNAHLLEWGFIYNDGKAYSPHLERCGFELKQRDVLQEALRSSLPPAMLVQWNYSPDLVLEQFKLLK